MIRLGMVYHTVYVKMPTGNTIKVYVPETYTVKSLKQVISKKRGMHPLCQQLTFNGRVLEDRHSLVECMKCGSKVDLMVRQGSKYIYCVSLLNTL